MIVVCTSCRARFRIADEKLGPRGARVRCSKCKNTFTVGPPGSPEPAGAEGPELTKSPARPPPLPAKGGGPQTSLPAAERPKQKADPFAFFTADPTTSPPPANPGAPSPENGRSPLLPTPFDDSLPAAAFSGLEGAGEKASAAADTAVATVPSPEPSEDGPSLEERTPVGIPAYDPSASVPLPLASDPFEGEFPLPEPASVSPAAGPVPLAGTEADPEPTFEEVVASPPAPPPAAAPASPAKSAGAPAGGRWALQSEEPVPVEADAFGPGRLRGVFLNALSLALLLVFTAGILLWWRGESVSALVRRVARAPSSTLFALVSENGYYETSSGRLLVFVRGEVRTPSPALPGPVRVRGEMVKGGDVVARAEGFAGAVPTPEELWAIGSSEAAAKLLEALARRAPAELVPGQRLPFLLTFVDYPPNVGDVSFRVAADPAPGR